MESLLVAFAIKGFLKGLMLVFFMLLACLLMLVVLLQEPKGGGLSAAFGGAGQDTFGVQAGGVNKFTAWVATIWMLLAVLYAAIPESDAVAASDIVREQTTEWQTDSPSGSGASESGSSGSSATSDGSQKPGG